MKGQEWECRGSAVDEKFAGVDSKKKIFRKRHCNLGSTVEISHEGRREREAANLFGTWGWNLHVRRIKVKKRKTGKNAEWCKKGSLKGVYGEIKGKIKSGNSEVG